MSVFPETSMTLIRNLAVQVTGQASEASWIRFFDLYTPAIRRFAEWNDRTQDPDDIVQEVYLKLVDILRSGQYSAEKARFRSFLAMLIRRSMISMYRKEMARGGRKVPLDDVELTVPPEQQARLDVKWRLAKHEAAVEHVLTKTALAHRSRDVYRAHVIEGRDADDVAREFGITKNLVGQIKFRLNGMIAMLEKEYADEDDHA